MPKWTCIGHNLPLVVLVLMTIYTLSLNRLIQNKTVRAKMKTYIFFNSFFFSFCYKKIHCYICIYFWVCVCSVMPIKNTNEIFQVAMLLKFVKILIHPRQDKKANLPARWQEHFLLKGHLKANLHFSKLTPHFLYIGTAVNRTLTNESVIIHILHNLKAFTSLYRTETLCINSMQVCTFPFNLLFYCFIELSINK